MSKNRCLLIANGKNLETFPVGDPIQARAFIDRLIEINGGPLTSSDRALVGKIVEQRDFSMFDIQSGLGVVRINRLSIYNGTLGKPQT